MYAARLRVLRRLQELGGSPIATTASWRSTMKQALALRPAAAIEHRSLLRIEETIR